MLVIFTIQCKLRAFITHLVIFPYNVTNQMNIISLICLSGMFRGPFEASKVTEVKRTSVEFDLGCFVKKTQEFRNRFSQRWWVCHLAY